MKNIATFMLVSALMLGFFTSCDSGVQHRTFRGIYADDPAGMEGLYNPERGFRLEVALDVTEKNYVWAPEEYPDITCSDLLLFDGSSRKRVDRRGFSDNGYFL